MPEKRRTVMEFDDRLFSRKDTRHLCAFPDC